MTKRIIIALRFFIVNLPLHFYCVSTKVHFVELPPLNPVSILFRPCPYSFFHLFIYDLLISLQQASQHLVQPFGNMLVVLMILFCSCLKAFYGLVSVRTFLSLIQLGAKANYQSLNVCFCL